MLSDVCLFHVCLMSVAYIRSAGGVCGRPAGWRILADPARPAWLKAAAARFRCRPGRGHIVPAARLHLVLNRFAIALKRAQPTSTCHRWPLTFYNQNHSHTRLSQRSVIMTPPLIGGALSDAFVWRLSRTSGLSWEQSLRKAKIGTEVAHVTRDSDTTFKVKGQGHQAAFCWMFKSLMIYMDTMVIACLSWILMQLGAAGVRRVGYGLEVGAGRAYCVATRTTCSYYYSFVFKF